MATRRMRVVTGPKDDKMKPLPSLPSPTLTNPDMVLPDEPIRFPITPPRHAWRDRPPSPSYLKERSSESSHSRDSSGGNAVVMAGGKKQKLGLMSRKMLLLRSRTASGDVVVQSNGQPKPVARGGKPNVFEGFEFAYGSSPTLMDVGNLAPEETEGRRTSVAESSASDDMKGLPQFLAKYGTTNAPDTDDELESSPAPQTYAYAASSYEESFDAQRKQQEEEEQASAVLSKRAEEILANAKKRLNLMEGNLRGAKELVAPLTADNLKRATSVGSSCISSTGNYGGRNRYVYDANRDAPAQQPYRALQAQASSPTMGRDYQGHYRGFSETELPERPYTALERTNTPLRTPTMASTTNFDMPVAAMLKGSRSYDSLGSSAMKRPSPRDAYGKASPDPNLEPLVEDDGPTYHPRPSTSTRSGSSQSTSRSGLGIHRSPSRSEDIREQMSSLKGRISSLRERAKEDSLRRQSMQNLREPSPLNNAASPAPEFFYTSSPSYGAPVLDTKAGVGHSSQNNSPNTPQSTQKTWEPSHAKTGSRNAFAEQAERVHQQGPESETSSVYHSPRQSQQRRPSQQNEQPQQIHKRTPSGTAVVQSSKHRYSHHQSNLVKDNLGLVGHHLDYGQNPETDQIGVAHDGSSQYGDQSEAGASLYEDAVSESPPSVVAHEDREDAFDYENFFLHSAMTTYRTGTRRRASSSSTDTATSTETARGPTTNRADNDESDEESDNEQDEFMPATPETPEQLKEIERKLHKRTYSEDSVSSLATFATANEGFPSPPTSKRSSVMDWPIAAAEHATRPSARPSSRPNSRPSTATSRPATAIPIKSPVPGSDSSSERADSGVGLNGSTTSKRPKPEPIRPKSAHARTGGPSACSATSPPMSPRMLLAQDPVTVAVNALLAPDGRPLGLRDKALLFSLVESLKKASQRLQDVHEVDHENRMLRRRLDEARRMLDGEVGLGVS